MKVYLKSTMTAFDDIEMNVAPDEIQALKRADVIEVDGNRYIPFELVFDADERKFIFWVDEE